MKEKAIDLAKKWASDPFISTEDQKEINKLLANIDSSEEELIDRFYKDLEFGTGGLRSIIGIGSNRMNIYNIRRATQAMANALKKENPKKPRACVSFDCRQYSLEFAHEVASVFAANGIETFVYNELTPTPMLSYAVRYYEAQCGVMVTASHNPKQYNGFKAYWSDGAQVTPPYDQNIIDEYNLLTDWNQIQTCDFNAAIESGQIKWVDKTCIDEFYQKIIDQTINKEMCLEHGSKVHFVYTPLHGTGYIPCKTISEKLGFSQFEIVESQAEFDSQFSTLKTNPNPEDPVALELAVALMKEANADITYGTDPDCDRLGVVVNHKGVEHFLNGNQIAILMIDYIFSQLKEKNQLPHNPLVIKSIVTSNMQKTIVEDYGGTVLDTLTGFKWMARLLKDLEDKNTDYNFVFASEESFGYMPYSFVRDKDAVASIALMNEIVLYHKLQDKTLMNALDDIYTKFGYAEESLIALTFEGLKGQQKIQNIMQYFRDHFDQAIAGNEIAVFQDFKSSLAKNLIEKTEDKIEMTASNVLSFQFTNGDILFVRPSGTEPKIKFYTMVQVKEGSLENKKTTAKETIVKIENFIHKVIEEL